jgi:hypothetical protein
MAPDMALPPGFKAICAADPVETAVTRAAHGADPGTIVHGDTGGRCFLAVVLTPGFPVEDSAVRSLGANALHDALAALAPVGLPIAIDVGQILVNGGMVATLGVHRAPTATAGVPDWLVLWIDVAIDLRADDPGLDPMHTCLAEEGFAATAAEVMAGFDAWEDRPARRVAA